MTQTLTLYTGPQCTLCEKAKRLIWPQLCASGQRLNEVDITTDVTLLRRYRLTIPVLAAGDRELNWPFDCEQLADWLRVVQT